MQSSIMRTCAHRQHRENQLSRATGMNGVGTQVAAGDLNGDGMPDVISGNKKGTHIHLQVRKKVDEKTWQAAQPRVLN